MSNERTYITTPVGRFIMGDAFTGSDKDPTGRPRLDQQGKPKTQWFMAIAFPKNDPGFGPMWQQINAVAQRDFPMGEWQRPEFAWKVVDGDAKYPDRDECRGCYIVRLSSGFAPTVYNSQNQQIIDPTQCKRGFYVRAYISVAGNADRQKPGIYINHHMIQVVGYGEEIVSGPSAAEVFATPAALPPGASAHPIAPAAPMPAAPGYPAAPAPAYGPPQPAYAPAPPAAPGYPAPAAYPTQPPAPAYAPAPTAPAGYPAPAPVAVAPAPPTAYPGNPPAPPPHPGILTPPGGPVR